MTNPTFRNPAELAGVIGVDIPSELLEQALTHRSFAYENGGGHYERLEFLGDAVLQQVVTLELFHRFDEMPEGDLAKRRAALVSTVALAEIARRIDLGPFIRLGNGEIATGGAEKSSILADVVEALIGATYLSLGQDAATDLTLRLVLPLFDDVDRFGASMEPKTELQELCDRKGLGKPVYSVESAGPDHARRFIATVTVDDFVRGTGEGTSKKAAEGVAALAAWTALTAK
ncbi:MAG: ribonuclease III [Microbacteriaceae bacterium]